MASIPPTGHQGGILPAPLPQPITAPAKTTNTSGADSGYVKREELSQIISDSLAQALERLTKPSGTNTGRPLLLKDLCHFCRQIGHTMVKGRCLELENYICAGKCRKNRDNKVVLPSGSYIPQYPEKLYYKDRLEEWHRLNSGNLATGNLSANATPDAQQQQVMNNMQAPVAATLVHEIVQEPRVDQYVLTTDKRIEYHQQELVQIPLPKQPLTNYHLVDTPESLPSANAKASSSCRKEPKSAEEKLLPKDKGKKPMKPTIEEVPEEALPPIHPYLGIPEISITEPTPKNVTTADHQQDGAYKMLAPAATKEQEWTIKAFNTIWDHNITMTVGGALAISQLLRNHFREMVTRITNANMVTISEIPDNGTNDILPYPGKSPPGTSAFHSNANTLNTSIMEPKGTVGAVDPVEAFYSHWPLEHCASLCVAKDTDSLRAIMVVINGKEEVECIVDSGSQIVSMLEEIAHHLGLVYDLIVILNMQSANGAIDQLQGLARNVPCTIAGLTIYLQVHVISQPAYDILLGKPFNILTRSIVRTLSANKTVITITDPNGGDSCTIATFERGCHKRKLPPPTFFLTDSEPPKCPFHAHR
ncbi:hypothetical protein C0995_012193 [Termitomyces sp. Mi166|nr:hypothetical protein C0995_012193 [Termitomyces sp. Mi166\